MGDGCDDCAAVLDRAQLERDGGADHGFLPFEGHGQITRPFAPVFVRLFLEIAGDLAHGPREPLVLRQDEVDGLVQKKWCLVEHEGDRHIGRQAQDMIGQHVANMVAAARQGRPLAAVIAGGTQADADARRAPQAADAAHQGQRAEKPPELLEPGCEVQNLDSGAVLREQAGFDDRRVGPIGLLAAQEAVDLDLVEPDVHLGFQQVAEHGIAVEARHAGPDDAPPRVDQRGIAAVADHAEFERLHFIPP